MDEAEARAELAARLEAIAGHEQATRDVTARQWEALAGMGAQLDQVHAETRGQWRVLAGVNLTLERVADALERARWIEQRREARLAGEAPVFYNFAATGVFPAAGPLVLDCGGPSVGREWHVKRLVVGGLTLATAAAGSAEVYVSGWIPDAEGGASAAPTSMSDLVDATILISSPQTDLPNIGNYDDGQVYVHGREHLWVVIRGGTVGQSYVAAGTTKDMRSAAHSVVDTVG